jgi:alanine racemase
MRFRSRLLVDLNQLALNIQSIDSTFSKQNILFMVKSEGYGHGMVPIVRFAVGELGIKEVGCATLGEALTLRSEIPDLEFEIYVFSDVQIELKVCADLYLHRRILPVISNQPDLEFLLEHPEFRHFPLCLKFNTGMNRLGLDPSRVGDIISLIKGSGRKEIYHLMTHFASAHLDLATDSMGVKQNSSFDELVGAFRSAGIAIERTSRSNSGAIEQKVGTSDTHIRPGLLVYGPSSVSDGLRSVSWWKGKLISQLETYIVHVFPVKKGDPIGYGATPVPRDGLVAIIALGYGDGFTTRFMGATLHHLGHPGEVVGRVNMDMAQVLFSPEAAKDLLPGDKFIVWGQEVAPFMELAKQTNCLTYELFCQLTSRVPRVHQLK